MRRNVLHIMAAICLLGICSACGDDNEVIDESWKELTGSYQTDHLEIQLNGAALLPGLGRKVDFLATSADDGVLILHNVLPEQANLEIPVMITKDDDGFRLTSVGTKGRDTSRSTPDVTGRWEKSKEIAEENQSQQEKLILELEALYDNVIDFFGKDIYYSKNVAVSVYLGSTPQAQQASTLLTGMINQALSAKLEKLGLQFKENGFFNVTWKKTNSAAITDHTSFMSGMTPMQFFVKDDLLYIAIDKQILNNPVISVMLPTVLGQYGFTMDQLMSLFTDLGGYLGIPFYYTVQDGTCTFTPANGLLKKLVTMGQGQLLTIGTGHLKGGTLTQEQVDQLKELFKTLNPDDIKVSITIE